MTGLVRSIDVAVVTWPPLWQYWPAYLAMARTEDRYHKERLRFVFDTVAPPVTDEALRMRLQSKIEDPSIPDRQVIALCEPQDLEPDGQPGGAGVIQRLPLIWRQPHWVLRRQSLGASTATGAAGRLWRFPAETTSGDYVSRMLQRLVMFRGSSAELKDLSEDLAKEQEVVAGLEVGDRVVTFTPWHRILSPVGAAEDAVGSSLEFDLLPGPSLDVTAVQVPDGGCGFFVDYLARQIKTVLNDLTDTQGEPDLIDGYFSQNDNFERVIRFLDGWGDRPFWLTRRFLGPALAEYIQLGCYFPYRTIDSAISAEIQKRVGDVLDVLRGQAVGAVRNAMTNFLGGAPDWADLSFEERTYILQGRHALSGRRPEDAGPLWRLLTHPSGEVHDRGFAALTKVLSVRHARHSQAYLLPALAAELPEDCLEPDRSKRFRSRCLRQQEGVVTPEDPVAPGLCIACALGGATISLARAAAAHLAREIRSDVSYRRGVGELYRCPVAYSDIEPLVSLFADEKRPFTGDGPPAEVAVYSLPPNALLGTGRVLIGIWWRGDTQDYGHSNNTGARMLSWSRAQTAAGRPVEWVGRWHLIDGRIAEAEASAGDKSPAPSFARLFEGGEIVTKARADFLKRGLTFGYTAVFQL